MFLALLEYVTQEGQSNFSDVFKISSQRTEIKSSLEKKAGTVWFEDKAD